MVTWHLTVKPFPAKCHEWATAKTMTSSGKQFTIIHKMLTAVTRDQKWPDVVTGISGRFSKFAFVLLCYNTYHLMTGPLGNSEFCFPRLRFSGNKIHCSPRNQSLSVKYFILRAQKTASLLSSNSLFSPIPQCFAPWGVNRSVPHLPHV